MLLWIILALVLLNIALGVKIMSELNDAVTRITTSVQTEIAAVVAALSAINPDVTAAVAQLNALSDKLDAETAAVTPPAA
jgi:outer membrane protein TolC